MIEHKDSEKQKADILTKALQRHAFDACLRMIGICSPLPAAVGLTGFTGGAMGLMTREGHTSVGSQKGR